jgi:hypothetical protein
MMIVKLALVALLLPGSLLATTPVAIRFSGPNRVVFSSDGRYCLEIHEQGGNGGCLTTPTELQFPINSEAASKLIGPREPFDPTHRTMVLFQKNDRGAYMRLWELRMPMPYQVVVSRLGDVLVSPYPIRIQEPFEQPRNVYRAYQFVHLVNATGRVADIRLGALLTNADVERLRNPVWSVRIGEKDQHRIIVLTSLDRGRSQSSTNRQGSQTIEYDVDRHKVKGTKRDRF